MDKIDLIIDALEKAKDGWQSFDEYDKALAAARELKALKPVAYVGGLNEFDAMRLKSEGFHMYTPLYALEAEGQNVRGGPALYTTIHSGEQA